MPGSRRVVGRPRGATRPGPERQHRGRRRQQQVMGLARGGASRRRSRAAGSAPAGNPPACSARHLSMASRRPGSSSAPLGGRQLHHHVARARHPVDHEGVVAVGESPGPCARRWRRATPGSSGGVQRALDLRVEAVDVSQRRAVGDPHAAQVRRRVAGCVGERIEHVLASRRRERPAVARVRPRQDVEHRRRVGDTCARAGPRWATVPIGDAGHAGTRPNCGLMPTVPVKAAGMRIEPPPSVPTASAPMPAATDAAAPPDEPPGRSGGIPRIAGDAAQRRIGARPPAELRRCGLAEQHRAGFAKPRGGRRVLGPGLVGIDRSRAAQCRPAAREDQVLDRGGHAVDAAERLARLPALLGVARRRHGAFVVDQAIGVEDRIERVDARQRRARDLHRRQVCAPVVRGQRHGVQPAECRHPRRRPVAFTVALLAASIGAPV